MNQHQELAILALENMRGDETHRAEHAFRGLTPRQMQEPYGRNGVTRQILLDSYRKHDADINAAIA